MSYLVLARKYRPQTFADIIGQSHVTLALRNAILKNRVPHALMFAGPRGVGKTTAARVLSKALNCTGREVPSLEEVQSGSTSIEGVEPCGECPNCIQIAKGSNLAVQEIDGASNNSVESVRQLIDSIHTLAPEGIAYKIYIIDEVHMLSTAAFNALLKSLEEPPPQTIFIFATTEPHKVPDTVLSRCQQHDFRRISIADIVSQLALLSEKEGFNVETEVFYLIARVCQGGMRDASSLLDRVCSFSRDAVSLEQATQVLGVFDFSHFANLLRALIAGDEVSALSLVREAFSRSIDVRAYVNDLVRASRILSLYSIARKRGERELQVFLDIEELSDVEREKLIEVTADCDPELVNRIFDVVIEVGDQVLRSSFPRYVLEAACIRLAQLGDIISLSDLLQKVGDGGFSETSRPISAAAKSTSGMPVDSPTLKKKEFKRSPNEILEGVRPGFSEEAPPAEVVESRALVWNDFLAFLKSSGELRLDTFLRRVVPEQFSVTAGNGQSHGSLSFLAQPFLAESCSDPETTVNIKRILTSFSGVDEWDVKVGVREQTKEARSSERPRPRSAKVSPPVSAHLPGSHQNDRHLKRIKQFEKLEQEATDDDFVKEALKIFEGSVIERVVPSKA